MNRASPSSAPDFVDKRVDRDEPPVAQASEQGDALLLRCGEIKHFHHTLEPLRVKAMSAIAARVGAGLLEAPVRGGVAELLGTPLDYKRKVLIGKLLRVFFHKVQGPAVRVCDEEKVPD